MNDCFDCQGADGRLMSVDLALVHLQTRVPPVAETENAPLPLRAALGRVLAEDQTVPMAMRQDDGAAPLIAGTLLGPRHLGLAAALGLTALPVRRRLRVALFSTGDEIRDPGQPLPPGCLYDANRPTLAGLLAASGCDVTDLGILPDRVEAIRDTLDRAAAGHDLIVTPAGGKDHVKAAVRTLGSLHPWRLALEPGEPLALGHVNGAAFLGLPGNPAAVMLFFLLFARPLIARLSGAAFRPQRRYPLPAAFTLRKKAGLREFSRARIVQTAFGPVVELVTDDISALMRSADGFVDLPETATDIAPGDPVAFLPFSEVMP